MTAALLPPACPSAHSGPIHADYVNHCWLKKAVAMGFNGIMRWHTCNNFVSPEDDLGLCDGCKAELRG